MAPRLSSLSHLDRTSGVRAKSPLTRLVLLGLLGATGAACSRIEVDDRTSFVQVPVNLARDANVSADQGNQDASEMGVDAGTDAVMPSDMTVVPDVTNPPDTGSDTGMGADADAGSQVVDVPTDVPADNPVDAGRPCLPVSITISGDNINNSYDTQTAVPGVINTTGDCSMVGASLPFNINYGPEVRVFRPILAVDPTRNQIRFNLDLTDPMFVGFPDNHRNVRVTTTLSGTMISGTFLRKRTAAAILPTGTLFPGLSRGMGSYTGRIVLGMATNSAAPTDDLNRDALVGIDVTDDSGTTLLSHGSLSSCNFAAETNPCLDPATDGSGRSQRCFIPNMLTGDRSTGACDISEQRVVSYPGSSTMLSLPMHSVDYNNLLTRVSPGAFLRVVVYATDIGLNVTTQTYRIRRGD